MVDIFILTYSRDSMKKYCEYYFDFYQFLDINYLLLTYYSNQLLKYQFFKHISWKWYSNERLTYRNLSRWNILFISDILTRLINITNKSKNIWSVGWPNSNVIKQQECAIKISWRFFHVHKDAISIESCKTSTPIF